MNADLARRARRLARLRLEREIAVRRDARAGRVVPPARDHSVRQDDDHLVGQDDDRSPQVGRRT